MSEDSGATILVIDDETTVRESIADYLEDREFTAITAENGRVGLERFAAEKVDPVLVDPRMPEVDDDFSVLDDAIDKALEKVRLLGENRRYQQHLE